MGLRSVKLERLHFGTVQWAHCAPIVRKGLGLVVPRMSRYGKSVTIQCPRLLKMHIAISCSHGVGRAGDETEQE
jgi:hypothetical protein